MKISALVMSGLLMACGASKRLVPANAEELTRFVLSIRELPDGTVTHAWQRAEEVDLRQYKFLSNARVGEITVAPVMASWSRDCDEENRECIRKCKRTPLPPGYGHITSSGGRGGKEEYCRNQCWQAYRDCTELERLRPREFTAIDNAVDFLKRNRKTILVGSVIVIAGVAFIVVSAGVGLVVLAPVVLLATPTVQESTIAERAP